MVLRIKGQIHFIGDPEPFDKGKHTKVVVALAQPNSAVKNRMEIIPYEFIDNMISLIEKKAIAIGDTVEIDFEQRGRQYITNDNKTLFYTNNEIFNIIVV